MRRKTIEIAALSLAALAGCGGGADGWLPDDIDREATLAQVGSAGYARLCSAFEDYARDQYTSSYLVQAVCTAIAIETTTTAAACGEQAVACKDNPPPEALAFLDRILAQAGCATVAVEPTGCAATVAQVQQCLDDLGTEVDEIQFTLTCAAAGQMLDDTWWQIALPPACATLKTACP